jgi:hypothetical protein
MKTRSALLLVFMIVVPAAAMFSHRIPADVRRAIREQMGRLTAAVLPAKPAPARAGGAAALDLRSTLRAWPQFRTLPQPWSLRQALSSWRPLPSTRGLRLRSPAPRTSWGS